MSYRRYHIGVILHHGNGWAFVEIAQSDSEARHLAVQRVTDKFGEPPRTIQFCNVFKEDEGK